MRFALAATISALALAASGQAVSQTGGKPGTVKPGSTSGAVAKPTTVQPPATAKPQTLADDPAIAAAMLKAQAEAQKDALHDRKIAEQDKTAALGAKNGKLAQDNASITTGMNEAKEKASNAMSAANTQLNLGIASGTLQAAGAARSDNRDSRSSTQTQDQGRDKPIPKPIPKPKPKP